ncbi:Aur protein kinase, variant [Plasmodium yoelii 17X]|uniref:Aur protein kinase, variant n=1 Tax=Plasmodium yoelii 17X TaxID=1323249 RepID=V7PI98_PLAYE|nr:Aur protein kinase, variant [Plasmodium yoelii 17X]
MNENIKSHNYLKEKNVLNKNPSNLVNDDILKFNTNIKRNNNVERFYHNKVSDSSNMYNKNGHHINKSVGAEKNISGNKTTNLVNIKNKNQRLFSKSENEKCAIRNINMREDNYTTNLIKGKDNDIINNRKNSNINNNEYLNLKSSDDKLTKNINISGYAYENILEDNCNNNGNDIRNDIEKDNNGNNNGYYSYNCKNLKKVKEPNNSLDSFYKRKRETEEENYDKKRINHSLNKDYYYNTYTKTDINDSHMNIKDIQIKDISENVSKIKNLENNIMNVKNMEKARSRVHNISESEKKMFNIINQSSNNSTKILNSHSFNTNESCNYDKYMKDIFNKNYDYKKIKNPENSYLETDENIISRSYKIEEEHINNSDDFIRRNFMYDNKLETKINETKSNKLEKNILTDIKSKNSNEYILKHKKNYNEDKGNNFCDNEFKQNKYDFISCSFNEEEEFMNDYINNTDFVKNKNEGLNKLIDINKNEEQNAAFTILNKENNINMETQEYNNSHENRKLLYNNVKDANEIEFNDSILNDFKMDVSKPIDTKNTISQYQEESNIIYKINNDNEDAKKDNWEYDLSSNNCKNQNDGLKTIGALNDIVNTYKRKLVDNTNNVLNKGQNKSDEDSENLLNKKRTESKKDNALDHKNRVNERNLISIASNKTNNNSNVSNVSNVSKVRNVNSGDISSTSSENKKNLIKKTKYNESISKRLFSTHTLSSNNKCLSSGNYLKNNIKPSIKNSFKETYKKDNLDRHKTIGFNRSNTNLDKINSNISQNNGITKNSIQKFPSSNIHTNLSNIQSKKKTIDNNYKNSTIENKNLEENNEKIKKRQKIEFNKTYNNSFLERMKKKNLNEHVDGNKNAFIQKTVQNRNNINFEKNKTKMFLSNNKSITNNGYNKNGLFSELAEKKEISKSTDKLTIDKKSDHSGHVEVGTKLEKGLGKEIEIGLQGEISINSKVEEKIEDPLYKQNNVGEVFRENVMDTNESNINYNSKSNTNKAKANALNRERINNNKEIRTLASSNSITKSGKNTLLVKRQNTNNYMRYGSKIKEIEDNKLKMKNLANNNKGIDNKYVPKWSSNKTSSSSNITNNIVDKKNNMLVKKDEINKKKKEVFNQVAKINTNINSVVENKQINLQTKKQHNKIINKDQNSTKSSNYNNKKCTPNSKINQSTHDTRKINENNTNRNCSKKKKNNNDNNNDNNKDIISKEMEKYKYLMKKSKIKSNSIPPGNQKEVEKNAKKYECRNNYRSRDDYDCNNKYGRLSKNEQINYDNMLFLKDKKGQLESDNEYPYTVQGVQNHSCYINNDDSKNDQVLEYLKEKDENISKNMNTSNSLNNGEEQKELSYFEWLAKEQEKKENEVDKKKKINKQDKLYHEKTENEGDEDNTLNKGVLNKHNDGANYDKMENNENEEDYDEEDSEEDKENDTNVMLQPLLAFNLKQNEKSYEQNDFIVDKHPIGNGRTGLVFKAIIRKENLQVALKVMAKDTILSLKIERQVLKEIIIQSSLKHINILDLIAYFEDKTRLFLVLEIANGGSIRNKMKLKHDTFKEEQVALYVYQIADALSYLHNFNIIHRDLKPDNILIHYSDSDVYNDEHASKIYKYGIIKIADFGFSCQLKNKRQKRSTFCGTVDYMPPEIINQIPYDCNADLWCLGIVIFELLVGFPPFTDNSQV